MKEKYIPTQAENHAKSNRKKAIIPVVLIVILICVLAAGTLIAKYISERSSDGWVRAKEFYFTSNLLDGKTHTLAPDSKEISFTLGNHADDLRYSEMDIKYKVSVTPEATVTESEGTLNTEDGVTDVTVSISGLEPGKTYTVTAVGEGGYKKTLTATIEVPIKATTPYYYIDKSNSDYTLLTIWNEMETAGNVEFEYTGIPDNTNPNMTEWVTGTATTKKKQSVEIKPHESKVFRFFGETEITVKDGTATEKKDIS